MNAMNDSRAPRRVIRVHQDVLEFIEDSRSDPQLVRRARLVLWQMFAQGRPTQVKSVRGAAKGWLRSDLGGNNGHQFYLWWATGGSIPLRGKEIDRDALLVRGVRHHDDTHLALDAGEPSDWLPISAKELPGMDLMPELLPTQRAVLDAQGEVIFVAGHPGTGKTTVLGYAAVAALDARVLYLTYSDALAVRAREYFREFASDPGAIEVMTFRALIERLDPDGPPLCSLEDELRTLRGSIEAHHDAVGPWARHLGALHAELHANYLGGALPFEFRGVPGWDARLRAHEGYVATRRDAVGEKAAEAAARVARSLLDRRTFERVASGPWRARRALDHLDGDAALPSALCDIDAVFVDEVQDLTRVEAALLTRVVERMRAARRVRLVAAGDEGQTVRPTDFEWGVLADLVKRTLGAPERYDLHANVRSPRALEEVLARVSELYKRLAKEQRPRGRGTDAIEESVSGKVLRCALSSRGELASLVSALKAIPRAAMVFPDEVTLPDGVDGGEICYTSEQAKGLDFSVVAVVGAARHLHETRALGAATDPLSVVLARTKIDQLRVAVSRPSDTLIFIDLAGDEGIDEVERLICAPDHELIEGCLGAQSLDEVIKLLDRGDVHGEELVRELVREIEALLATRPEYALERARLARGMLGRSDSSAGVTDRSLRAEVARLQGCAALLSAFAAREGSGHERFAEASRCFVAAKEPGLSRVAICARDVSEQRLGAAARALELCEVMDDAMPAAPVLQAPVREALTRWLARCDDAELPSGPKAKREAVEAVEAVVTLLGEPDTRADITRRRVVEALIESSAHRDALAIAVRVREDREGVEARCHELLNDHAAALALYEGASRWSDALRCARALGELDKARALAERAGAEELELLSRVCAARDAIAALDGCDEKLTASEHDRLRACFEHAVPTKRRRGARSRDE